MSVNKLAVIGLLLATTVGCQATPDQDQFFRTDADRLSGLQQLGHYAGDVGLDFLDIFSVNVGAGKAGPFLIFANAHATKYLEAGVGHWSGYSVGTLGRGAGIWREERNEEGFSLLLIQNYYVNSQRVPYYGSSTLAEKYLDVRGYDIDLDQNNHWGDFGFSLYLIGLGGSVNVSPYEALDFVFGLVGNYPNPDWMSTSEMPWDFGTDIADDDYRVSIYDDKIGRYRHNPYTVWPTIWPTSYGHHEQMEGTGNDQLPVRGPETGSAGGAYGDVEDN